jgi:hypothetical protein
MNIEEDFEDMLFFQSCQSEQVQEHTRVISRAEAGIALHIDKNVPESFTPRMPKSAMSTENDSVARVTVATTLLGCYIGYFRGEYDIEQGAHPPTETRRDTYRGGYEISKLDYVHALKPDTTMCVDATNSGELWLVPYNEEHAKYIPTKIGKVFATQMTYFPVASGRPHITVTLVIENFSDDELNLTNKTKLAPKSYHKVEVVWGSVFERHVDVDDKLTITEISKEEYSALKSQVATMLELPEVLKPGSPRYLSW